VRGNDENGANVCNGWKADIPCATIRECCLLPGNTGKIGHVFSGLVFCAGAFAFAFFALIAPWSHYDNLSDTIFAMFAFIIGALVFGALGKDLLAKASEMKDDHRQR
jgi:hypothetical protein